MRDKIPVDTSCPVVSVHSSPYHSSPGWPLACAHARRRIARQIHDSLGQLVAAAGMTVTRMGVPSATEADREAQRSRLGRLVTELATMIRSIEAALHPALLDQSGLDAALRARLAQAGEDADGARWTANIDEDIEAAPGDPLLIYRLAESMVITYLASMRPRAFALDVRVTPEATVIALSLADCGPAKGSTHATDAAVDPFSFIALGDWLTAAQATLHEAAHAPGQRVITVSIPHHRVPETA